MSSSVRIDIPISSFFGLKETFLPYRIPRTAEGYTCHVKFQDFESFLVHIQTLQKAISRASDVSTSSGNDRKVCRFQQTPCQLESNASRGRGCKDPRGRHGELC